MSKPKFQVGEHVIVNDGAPGDYREQAGIVVERGPGKAEYGVHFPADHRADIHYLRTSWLDRTPDIPQ